MIKRTGKHRRKENDGGKEVVAEWGVWWDVTNDTGYSMWGQEWFQRLLEVQQISLP